MEALKFIPCFHSESLKKFYTLCTTSCPLVNVYTIDHKFSVHVCTVKNMIADCASSDYWYPPCCTGTWPINDKCLWTPCDTLTHAVCVNVLMNPCPCVCQETLFCVCSMTFFTFFAQDTCKFLEKTYMELCTMVYNSKSKWCTYFLTRWWTNAPEEVQTYRQRGYQRESNLGEVITFALPFLSNSRRTLEIFYLFPVAMSCGRGDIGSPFIN